MDGIQQQIVNLNNKIDQLHTIVEHLSQQVSALVTETQQATISEEEPINLQPLISSGVVNSSLYSSIMEHKDILLDNSNKNNKTTPNHETTLSADIQIRRLTAQLTAAYNRIAALEEQLLTYRIHSNTDKITAH